MNLSDAAIGWLIILGLSATVFYGIPFGIRWVVGLVDGLLNSKQLKQIQEEEELDELARLELLAILDRAASIDPDHHN